MKNKMMLTNCETQTNAKTIRDPTVDLLPITKEELEDIRKKKALGLNEEIKIDYE